MDKTDQARPQCEELDTYCRPVFAPRPETEHYHQYEDEVCLKCDNAELLSRQTESCRPAVRNVVGEGCDYQYIRPRLPQPPHHSQVSYPGYPRVSVQELARQGRPGYYDDTIPYFPPPRPFPPRFSQPRRHLPPPPRFAGGPRHFRPPQHMVRLAGPGEDQVVTMRYQDVPVRRPLSEVSPRHWGHWGHWGQPRPVDPTSLPRRRLPEIPQQRRLPDTLPRTGRPSYEFDQEPPQKQEVAQRKSPVKYQDDIERRRKKEDKYQKQETKATPRQSKGSSRSPGRQG